MTRRLWIIGFSILLVGAGTVAPANAATSSEAAAKRAAELDALRASDAELTAALKVLDEDVKRQRGAVDTAQRALDAANQALAAQEAVLLETTARADRLSGIAAERAIEEYVRPQNDSVTQILASKEFTDASRRSALLSEVNGNDADTLDALRAARIDLDRDRKATLEARRLADERRTGEQAKLDALNAARTDKAKLEQSLRDRIETYAAEDAAGARATSATAAGRASRSAAAPADDGRISASGMKWPVSGPLRSPFGPRWGSMHTGIDIGASEGVPIKAAKAGTVISAGWDGSGYGNIVRIDHGGGVQTWYAHQSRVAVRVGQSVGQGDLIGYVGHTGHVVPASAAGAHLHFEVRINGVANNPAKYLP